jgi:CelD/BcsL family acetyltransferase involved in cellulose biosynthesis
VTTHFQVEVLLGRDAVARALTAERLAEWRALAATAGTVSVYQSPAFALTWYEAYQAEYEPLLLLGTAGDGAVAGVLPLALRRDTPGSLGFAGAEHCEYAGWLAAPPAHEAFPAACVGRLSELGHFREAWDWKWLAPGASLAWLERPELAARGITARVSRGANPVLALQDAGRPRFFEAQGKNFKRKMNLLKRAGEVRLVRLDAESLTEHLFERFKTFYDIRQLARYGVAPFREDPRKGPFHRKLLEVPDLALCFALMVGAEPVAFHWSLVGGRRAMYCMGPFDVRWLAASPGKLMADLVADALRERGLDWLDHTPGGDEYKEEAASTHEPIDRVLLFPSRTRAWAHGLDTAARGVVKRAARLGGVSPASILSLYERVRRAARAPVPTARVALRSLRSWAWSRSEMIIYWMPRERWEEEADSKPDPVFRKDMLEDFLGYAGSFRWISRQHLMQSAIERLRRGSHCYTVVEDGVLIYYGWLHVGIQEMDLTELGDYKYRFPPSAAVLYDDRTDVAAARAVMRRTRGAGARERRGGLHKRAMLHRFHEGFAMGADYALASILVSNTLPSNNVANLGIPYEPFDRVIEVRRFGRRRVWQESLAEGPGRAGPADAPAARS